MVGTWILGAPQQEFAFEASWQWIIDSLSTIGPAFLLGCGILGIIASAIAFFSINGLWRYSVAKEWKKRQSRDK